MHPAGWEIAQLRDICSGIAQQLMTTAASPPVASFGPMFKSCQLVTLAFPICRVTFDLTHEPVATVMNLPSPAGLSRSHVRCPGCISWVGDGCVASRALSSRRSLTARPRMHGARAALTETVQVICRISRA